MAGGLITNHRSFSSLMKGKSIPSITYIVTVCVCLRQNYEYNECNIGVLGDSKSAIKLKLKRSLGE